MQALCHGQAPAKNLFWTIGHILSWPTGAVDDRDFHKALVKWQGYQFDIRKIPKISVYCQIHKHSKMDATDIISGMHGQYIDNVGSTAVEVSIGNGDKLHCGSIKAVQSGGNARSDIWNITCEGRMEIMLDGKYIISIRADPKNGRT